MHGVLRIGLTNPALKIESRWEGLTNPELDAAQVEGGEEGVREHASTRMKEKEGDEAWATVRVEGRDWGRVLGVGRLGGRVIAGIYTCARASFSSFFSKTKEKNRESRTGHHMIMIDHLC